MDCFYSILSLRSATSNKSSQDSVFSLTSQWWRHGEGYMWTVFWVTMSPWRVYNLLVRYLTIVPKLHHDLITNQWPLWCAWVQSWLYFWSHSLLSFILFFAQLLSSFLLFLFCFPNLDNFWLGEDLIAFEIVCLF